MALKIRVHERFNEAFSPKTVKIGNQTWMADNLAIDDGKGGITYNEDNGEYYYTWDAAMRVSKSIPGWHLPTALEWNEAALACGASEKPFSNIPNLNEYEDIQELKNKLDVKLVGRDVGFVGSRTYFWTSTNTGYSRAYSRYFRADSTLYSDEDDKSYGYSVRLVKD